MMKSFAASMVRHALTAGGTLLAAKGLMATSMIEPVTGAIMLLGGVVWSAVKYWREHR